MATRANAVTSEPLLPEPRRHARHSREARIKFWRVFIVTTFFAVVISANVLVGAVVLVGSLRAQSETQPLPANLKTARVTRPMLDGIFCRHMVFDNKTAATVEDKIERCDGEDRKRKTVVKPQFSWGGR